MCSSQYLESLDVSDNSLSSDSVHILFSGLQQNSSLDIGLKDKLIRNCSLKKLNLSGNLLGDSEVTYLGKELETNKTITKLELQSCSMTTIGGAALASSLMINSTIEVLDISRNSLGGGPIQKFSELLQRNKTLKSLFIYDDNSLTQSDIDTLLNSATDNQTLTELRLPLKFRVKETNKRVNWI